MPALKQTKAMNYQYASGGSVDLGFASAVHCVHEAYLRLSAKDLVLIFWQNACIRLF